MQRRKDAIRVLIVDDSAVVRGVLGRMVDSEPDMRVVTTAMNGRDALDALKQQQVDVVLLDIEMPVMDGMTALPLIVARHPTSRVLITSALTHQSATMTTRALTLGAVDYVHKPATRNGGVSAVELAAAEIIAKIRAVASGNGASIPAASTATNSRNSGISGRTSRQHNGPTDDFEPRILAMAASTGGPNALATVIAGLPGDFPIPVVVTQHMPPLFTTMFAQRLAREGSLPCDEGRDGEPLLPGHVYVAPGDHHLTVISAGNLRSHVIQTSHEPPEHHCRPAADPMFRSVAHAFSDSVLAVVLTGMGEDGRSGCETIVRAGGRVVVQDAATSVVWGMPGSIVGAGVPCTVLPLNSIPAHITSLCMARA